MGKEEKDTPRIRFACKLREERENRKITRKELALKSGVSMQNIYKLEAGTYNPSLDIVGKIADALDMEIVLINKNF